MQLTSADVAPAEGDRERIASNWQFSVENVITFVLNIGRPIARNYEWGPISRLLMLIQLKLILYAYCTPIFLFQARFKLLHLQVRVLSP